MKSHNLKKTLLTASLIIYVITQTFAYTGEVVKTFKTPGNYPTGLTFDGKNLWIADRETDKIYSVEPSTGKVLHTIESPAYWPMGLAWDGKYLWNADFRGLTDIYEDRDGMIFKIDPKTGNILKTLKAPSKSPVGLVWDGEYLWCVDDKADKIIQFSTEDGTTINSFPSPSSSPTGLSYDGKYLWVSDRVKNEIYMVDPKTGYVIVITDAPGPYIQALAYDGKNLWAADYEEDKIYQMKIKDDELFVKKDEELHKVVYWHKIKNFGPGKVISVDANIALPENRVNQTLVGDFEYVGTPTIETDKWGQKTAHFSYENLEPGNEAQSAVITTFKSYNVRYFIYPEKVGELKDISKDVKDKYLGDNEKYQINHPIIQKTVKEVVGNETNAYWVIRKLHQYLIGHLHYIMDGAWDTAPTVISNGHGSCSEYSFVFISLCKAAGIPARYVGATWIKGDNASMDEVYHRWIEVYLPNYGWVPTDPTHGDRVSPRDQAFPIGLVRNKALITTQSGGGSETLGWSYNSYETYVTEPKTNVNIVYYGDWEPVKE